MSLENAPQHVKLAVDLIQLLEENEVPETVVLDALKLVSADYQRKLQQLQKKDPDSQ